MSEIKLKYMLVSYDITPIGINVSVMMCSVDFYQSEKARYPHRYTYLGEHCTWLIYASNELTAKMQIACGEQADRMCQETEIRNQKRLPVNRR